MYFSTKHDDVDDHELHVILRLYAEFDSFISTSVDHYVSNQI